MGIFYKKTETPDEITFTRCREGWFIFGIVGFLIALAGYDMGLTMFKGNLVLLDQLLSILNLFTVYIVVMAIDTLCLFVSVKNDKITRSKGLPLSLKDPWTVTVKK